VSATPTNTPTSAPTNTSTATATNTPLFTPTGTPPPMISGTVTYGNAIGSGAARPVSNVSVNGTGSPSVSTLTGSLGTYSLSGFGAGPYTITPSKSGGQNGSITSFDAARIAQYIVGNAAFSTTQQLVADVSGAGGISSFDAALVAKYAISSPPFGSAGNWIFIPASNTHPSVSSSITGEDYSALLMGDVSGNWLDPGASRWSGNGPEKAATVTVPKLTTPAGRDINIPIHVDGAANKGIISCEFELRFDPLVMRPHTDPIDRALTQSKGFSVVANTTEPGVLRVAAYGAMPLADDGILLNLQFTAIGKGGSVSPIRWTRIMLNEGVPRATTIDGELKIFSDQATFGKWIENDVSWLYSS
jgi:Cohesin domain/Dockerin type I domain